MTSCQINLCGASCMHVGRGYRTPSSNGCFYKIPRIHQDARDLQGDQTNILHGLPHCAGICGGAKIMNGVFGASPGFTYSGAGSSGSPSDLTY